MRPIGAARTLLLLGWAAIAVAVLVTGSLAAPWADLEQAVASGAVTEVIATEGYDDPAVPGYGVQEVRWRDVVPQLRALATGGLAVSAFERPYSSSSAFGFQVPPALGVLAAAWWICSVTLLAGGPEPFWATRWAWVWLSLLPGGVIACLLLSGPAPLLPSQRTGSRRLTGGWSLLFAVAVLWLT